MNKRPADSRTPRFKLSTISPTCKPALVSFHPPVSCFSCFYHRTSSYDVNKRPADSRTPRFKLSTISPTCKPALRVVCFLICRLANPRFALSACCAGCLLVISPKCGCASRIRRCLRQLPHFVDTASGENKCLLRRRLSACCAGCLLVISPKCGCASRIRRCLRQLPHFVDTASGENKCLLRRRLFSF